NVTGKMLDYTAHMSSIQAKYWDEEEKSGAKRRCGVQVGGTPGVRSHRHRAKMPFVLPIRARARVSCGAHARGGPTPFSHRVSLGLSDPQGRVSIFPVNR